MTLTTRRMVSNLFVSLMTLANIVLVASQGCSDPLGLSTNQISDDSLSATTWQPGRSDPWYGRLNNQSRRSWCSTVLDINQYIQVDLGPKQRRITAVASQGSHNYHEWVTSYKMSYSPDGGKWYYYKEGNIPKIFSANNNRWSEVKHQIDPPITAVALRFHPTAWSGDMCMRVEAYGCDVFSEAFGVEKDTIIKTEYIRASSGNAHYGRLNFPSGAWEERARFGTTYLEISIGRRLSLFTAVATQGSGVKVEWVKTYKLSYNRWGEEWMVYNEDGKAKVFSGNKDQNTIVKHHLRHNFTAMLIRFLPQTWYNNIAMRVEVYGGKVCQEPLGAQSGDLPNMHFTASGDRGTGNEPWKGRLNGGEAWCAGNSNSKEFLQIELGNIKRVSSVATQGHPVSSHWVKEYGLSYSTDGFFWRKAIGEDRSMILVGNSDGNTVKKVYLYKHVKARFLRFLPGAWNGGICMRVEVYGCEDCDDPIGLERGNVPNEAFTASSWYNVDHEPWLARLYSREGEGAWCSQENDGAQYLQVDLGQIHIMTGVAVQGKYEISEWAMRFRAWVTNFSLSFSNDQMTWTSYIEDGDTPKIFEGNSQSNQVVRRSLLKRIVSRHLRFLPVTWFGWTCMRVEIFGCRACADALGMEDVHIPDESIISSSYWGSCSSRRSRLFMNSVHSWMPGLMDRNAFLQIEIDKADHVITGVASQGYRKIPVAVVKFQLSFSRDGLHWFDYKEDGEVRIFESTFETNTVTRHFLKQNVTARFVRFWPKEWHGRRYLRVEVYGCKVCSRFIDSPNVTANAKNPDVLTYNGSDFAPWHGNLGLNNVSAESSWCGSNDDPKKIQFLQLDLKLITVTQTIAIQGHSTQDKWVKKFTISSSLDGTFWKQYKEGGTLKVIDGNINRHSVVTWNIKYNLRARYLRIHPVSWNNHPCLRLEVFAKEDCIDALGMESGYIADEAITASTALRVNYEPWLARLHSQLGGGAWCAKKNDENQYLHIDLLHLHRVTRIATQGKYPMPGCTTPDAWVTSYMLQFRQDMSDWKNYTENGVARIFPGNRNWSRVVVNDLKRHVTTRYVRFRPINWFNRICARMEIYGCKGLYYEPTMPPDASKDIITVLGVTLVPPYFQPLGMEDFSITNQNVRSPFHGTISYARLNYMGNSPFCAARREVFFEIHLGQVFKTIAAVATQGRYRGYEYIRTYQLAFSREEGEWFYYKENGENKELQGNRNADGTVLHMLQHGVIARYVRLITNNWVGNTCFRMEVYGSETRTEPLGITSGFINNDNMTSSSDSGPGNEPWMARLNVGPGAKAWCAAPSDTTPYLQIDLGRMVIVTQIAMAGKSGKGMVTSFKLSSSEEGAHWRKYRTGSKEKVFTAVEDYSQAFKFQLESKVKARFFKFHPQTWANLSCMSVELFGYEVCTWPLGLSEWIIPNDAMSASTSLGTNYEPWMGRLGAKVAGGAWCAKDNNSAQYLQTDLGHVAKIRRLGIQGKEGTSRHPMLEEAWVKNFTMAHSVDGFAWTYHKDAGGPKVFTGNSNAHEAIFVSLEMDIIGRYIRIFPKSWQHRICMRLEFYGCEACADPLGMESYDIPNYSLLSSSGSGVYNARLNSPSNLYLLPQEDEYVQVDLGPGGKTVTAVGVQGFFSTYNKGWVSKLTLNFSRDGREFSSYVEDGVTKILQIPPENHMFPWKVRLQYNITARYIRLMIKDWVIRPIIKLELYGCEACSESYGIGNDVIPVSLSSSSSSRPSHEPEMAKLLSYVGSWCAGTAEKFEYLQLDFGKIMMLTTIASQGHHSNNEYVSRYRLLFSVDGTTWVKYVQAFDHESKTTNLSANTDSNGVRLLKFLNEVKARYLQIVVLNWHKGICLRVKVFGFNVCDGDLGMEISKITNSSITAYSHLGKGYEPWNARYNRHYGKGAWCSHDNKRDEFIEVDLKRVHVISRVAVQKKLKTSPDDAVGEAWVTKFVIAYSENGSNWSEYSEGAGVKEFSGNKRHKLAKPVHARFVRLLIKEWHNHICLRMELYGCQACLEPLGLENFQLSDASLTSSSFRGGYEPLRARLGYYKREMWCALHQDLNQFLKVDLGTIKTLTAIATQGNAVRQKEARLREYYLQYSDDGSNWAEYTAGGERKIFLGYKNNAETSMEYLPQNITARFIKLLPTHWYSYICTKIEIYGCEA